MAEKIGMMRTAHKLMGLKTAELLLAAGEMTSAEVRTVRAVLQWIYQSIREEAAKKK